MRCFSLQVTKSSGCLQQLESSAEPRSAALHECWFHMRLPELLVHLQGAVQGSVIGEVTFT